jgi:hypothetical protein
MAYVAPRARIKTKEAMPSLPGLYVSFESNVLDGTVRSINVTFLRMGGQVVSHPFLQQAQEEDTSEEEPKASAPKGTKVGSMLMVPSGPAVMRNGWMPHHISPRIRSDFSRTRLAQRQRGSSRDKDCFTEVHRDKRMRRM